MIKSRAIKLTVAHINDTHSYFEPTSLQLNIAHNGKESSPFVSAGGFARIKTRVEQLRHQALVNKQGFLFLHAGDCFQARFTTRCLKAKPIPPYSINLI